MDVLLSGTDVTTGASDVLLSGIGVIDDSGATGVPDVLLSGTEMLDDSGATGVSDVLPFGTGALDGAGTSGELLIRDIEEVLER